MTIYALVRPGKYGIGTRESAEGKLSQGISGRLTRGYHRRPVKAILYAAKSTEDKRGSIPTQLADCRAMAEREGWEIAGEYDDVEASAWSSDRGPRLGAAMEHAERIAPCALIVQHSDRLARGDAVKARHLVEIVLWALKSEVTIRSVQDDIFADERIALLMGALMGQRNTEDSRRKSAAVAAGMKRRAEAGKATGGPRPYGYTYAEDGAGLVQVPHEAEVVRRVFTEAAAGRAIKRIAQGLDRDGISTVRGGRWRSATVSGMLRNPVYIGRVRRNGDTYPGEHDAIVDAELWDGVAQLLATRRSKGRGRPPRGPHLFRGGMLRCGECGEAMVPRSNDRGWQREIYYCNGRSQFGADTCSMPTLKRAEVDAAVYGYFEKVGLDVEATRQQFAAARDRKLAEVRGLLADAEAEAQRATDRLARVRGYFQDGRLDPDDWADQRDQLTAELEAAQAEAARLRDQEREVESWSELRDVEADTLRHLSEIRQAIAGEVRDAEGLEAVRAALTRLFERFVVHHGKDLDHAIALMDERKMGTALLLRPGPSGVGPSGVRLVMQPIVREAAIVGYEEDRTWVFTDELAEELERFTGRQHGRIDWAEFERWRGAPVEFEYETHRGSPILRREGLSQAENKERIGLPCL